MPKEIRYFDVKTLAGDKEIEVWEKGVLAYTLIREKEAPFFWECRKAGTTKVITRNQYRNDILEALQFGRFK